MSDIVERLLNTPNWTREESGAWGFTTHVRDRAPFEAADEIEKLRAALSVAVDAVEHWASYASSYAQEKHDLAGDLQKLRAALGEKE